MTTHSKKQAVLCLPWLAWVVPEVLAVIDIIVYLASTVVVDTQKDRSKTACGEWKIQDARYAIWAGFGLSVILSFIVFGAIPTLKTPLI